MLGGKRQWLRISAVGVLGACLFSGCAANERKIARGIDPTQEILQDVSRFMAADLELNQFPITVDGFKGNMRLKGQVQTEAQKARAEKLVWAARGVRSVQNELAVENAANLSAPRELNPPAQR